MSATDALENKFLSLYLENAEAANIGDSTGLRGSSTAGNLYVSLHESDPGDTAGTGQTQGETDYTDYARVAVERSSSAWTVASGVGDNDASITFPECGASGGTITHVALGSAATSTGNRDMNGAASLGVSQGVTPQFAAGALDISLD